MKQITISGVIGWDVLASDVREKLDALGGADVEIIVSSPGGFVSEGLEIFNLIRNYAGKTVSRLSGYAMSMASYIPLAADRVVAEDNAVYMIHNVRGGVWGDHNEVLREGKFMQSLSRLFAKTYAKRTGKDLDEVVALMDDETYFFGEEMVAAGFVDEVIVVDAEDDRDDAVALAEVAFKECVGKMSADVKAVKDDLDRAASMLGDIENKPRVAKAAAEKRGGSAMTLEQLRAEHPDLVAAVETEARAGFVSEADLQTQIAAARVDGAQSERDRIADCRAQSLQGHEELVETMAFDGESSGADVALAIVQAERDARTVAGGEIDVDANDPAAHADGDELTGKVMKLADFNEMSQQEQRAFVKEGGRVAG